MQLPLNNSSVGGKLLPVLVWIYEGGFVEGTNYVYMDDPTLWTRMSSWSSKIIDWAHLVSQYILGQFIHL